jgi:hypothetical protein
MKYFVIKNKKQQRNQFLYDIVDFLWDNGNEVHVSGNYCEADFEPIIQSCDCIVILNYEETCLDKVRDAFQNSMALGKSILGKPFLCFLENGIYTNIIPFPYKIFDFKQLDKNELFRFFCWYKELKSLIATSKL